MIGSRSELLHRFHWDPDCSMVATQLIINREELRHNRNQQDMYVQLGESSQVPCTQDFHKKNVQVSLFTCLVSQGLNLQFRHDHQYQGECFQALCLCKQLFESEDKKAQEGFQ